MRPSDADALAAWLSVRAATDWRALTPHALDSAPVRIDVAQLQTWSSEILGEPVALRTTDAFAKSGAERYGSFTAEHFAACVAEAQSAEHVIVRAARLYLDICFFHPFADGNARLAAAALRHVLQRELPLRAIAVERWAHDRRGPEALVRLLTALAR